MIRALFGGSFDPFHEGHRAIVEVLLERGFCDVVHVVPAGRSPFKDAAAAAGRHRLAMARLGVAGLADAVVEDLEVLRGGPSYTVDTLRELHRRRPDDVWRLVMGADAYDGLPRWRSAATILSMAAPLVLARRGGAVEVGPEAVLVADFDAPVSATEVRARLAAGDPDGASLTPGVVDYIRRHGLYGLPVGPEPGGEPCP